MYEYFDEYKNVLKKYADFNGRATVREFWSFYLINSVAGFLLLLLVPALGAVFLFGTLLPGIAVGVRRLHDQNRNGAYSLIAFIPLGVVVLLFWATQPGTAGRNDFGPDPTRRSDGQSPRPQPPSRSSRGTFASEMSQRYRSGKEFESSGKLPSCPNPNCDAKPSENSRFCAECGWDLKTET